MHCAGLKSDTIKFYNEMNAVAKKIAQASSLFFLLFSFFFGTRKNAVANTLRRQVSTFFFVQALGDKMRLASTSHYEYILTKLN